MNDISKQNIRVRLEQALIKEKMTAVSAGVKLGIKDQYISVIKNPSQWHKCGDPQWESVLKWINSGQTLTEYGEKHGKTVPEVKDTVLKVVEVVSETKPIVQKTITPDVQIKIKPGVLEKRKKEIESQQRTPLVNLLIEERAVLRQKLDAINTLLQTYNS